MNLQCIVVDDEPLAIDVLEAHIQRYPGLVLNKKCSNALEAMAYLRDNPVDLIFLDIMMPRFTGIQFLTALKEPPMVIFTTAHRKYALDGYDFNIVDFLLKPIPFDRFAKAVDKAFHSQRQRIPKAVNTAVNENIYIRSGTKMVNVVIGEILYVEGMKDYVKLHTTQEKVIVVKKTMKSIEKQFIKYNFLRIHKSFIVSVRHVHTAMSNRIRAGNHIIPVGRMYRQHVKNFLDANLFDPNEKDASD